MYTFLADQKQNNYGFYENNSYNPAISVKYVICIIMKTMWLCTFLSVSPHLE
jgi:hypothetical protein